MRKLIIRKAKLLEAEALSLLIGKVLHSTKQYPLWVREREKSNYECEDVHILISNPNVLVVVAIKNNTLVGFALGRCITDDIFSLDWVGVDPNHRRQGISLRLLKYVHHEVGLAGRKTIFAEVNPLNGPSLAMLATASYRPTREHRLWSGIEHQLWVKKLRTG